MLGNFMYFQKLTAIETELGNIDTSEYHVGWSAMRVTINKHTMTGTGRSGSHISMSGWPNIFPSDRELDLGEEFSFPEAFLNMPDRTIFFFDLVDFCDFRSAKNRFIH